ncbi:hypothetical protein J6590_093666 [Homalodisca vitripennis]|nr:hypothetical protein J6590_093666 [Homalodisca vitripennis]
MIITASYAVAGAMPKPLASVALDWSTRPGVLPDLQPAEEQSPGGVDISRRLEPIASTEGDDPQAGRGATHTAAAAAVTQRGESAAAAGGARVTQRGVSQRYLSYAQSGSVVCGRSGAARNKTRVYTKTC